MKNMGKGVVVETSGNEITIDFGDDGELSI